MPPRLAFSQRPVLGNPTPEVSNGGLKPHLLFKATDRHRLLRTCITLSSKSNATPLLIKKARFARLLIASDATISLLSEVSPQTDMWRVFPFSRWIRTTDQSVVVVVVVLVVIVGEHDMAWIPYLLVGRQEVSLSLSLSLSLPFFYSKDRFPLRGWLLLDLGSHTVTEEQDDAVKFELKLPRLRIHKLCRRAKDLLFVKRES